MLTFPFILQRDNCVPAEEHHLMRNFLYYIVFCLCVLLQLDKIIH